MVVLVLYYFCGDVQTVGEFLILDFYVSNLKMLLYRTNCSLTAHINGIIFRNVCCYVSETGDSTDSLQRADNASATDRAIKLHMRICTHFLWLSDMSVHDYVCWQRLNIYGVRFMG